MKCKNMKVVDIFFLVNFVTIYSSVVPEHTLTSHSQQSPQAHMFIDDKANEENAFEKKCPHILKMIRDKNLTEYTVNCKMVSLHTKIDSVLQDACRFVNRMLGYLCEKKIDNISVWKQDNVTSVCPFQFSHLQQMGFKLSNFELVQELTKEDHCSTICSDFYETKPQCIVLNMFNEYLKSLFSPATEKNAVPFQKEKLATKPEYTKIQKTETSINNTKQIKDDQPANIAAQKIMSKEIKNQTKLESLSGTLKNEEKVSKEENPKIISMTKELDVPNHEEKVLKEEKPKIISTTKELDVPRNEEEKTLENKNVPENTDYKDDIAGQSEELDDGLNSLSNANPDGSKLGAPEKISGSSGKWKEIYSGEGFFQAEDSHFFFYFIVMSLIIVIGYVAFHNKNKILAYALEGTSSRRNRRRPNPARYRKLETNLEEAISSSTINSAASSVVY